MQGLLAIRSVPVKLCFASELKFAPVTNCVTDRVQLCGTALLFPLLQVPLHLG